MGLNRARRFRRVSSVVVDLGCWPHRGERSLEYLAERYRPQVVYGFDPWPAMANGLVWVAGVPAVLARRAAWIENGHVEYVAIRGVEGWSSTVMREKNGDGEWEAGSVTQVSSFDFSAWLAALAHQLGGRSTIIVKMDIEGAEFPVLERMLRDGTDVLVSRLLVEWHSESMGGVDAWRSMLMEGLRCAVEPWLF